MLMPLPARQLDPQVLTICLQAVSGFLRLRALSVPTLCARILEFKAGVKCVVTPIPTGTRWGRGSATSGDPAALRAAPDKAGCANAAVATKT